MAVVKPDWVSVTTYARIYGVDRATVYKWLREKLLDTYRVGRVLRVRNLEPDRHDSARRSVGSR
jgi:excisionase family DNA binding protein